MSRQILLCGLGLCTIAVAFGAGWLAHVPADTFAPRNPYAVAARLCEQGIHVRVVLTTSRTKDNFAAYLTSTDRSWEELAGLSARASPDQWRGSIYCQPHYPDIMPEDSFLIIGNLAIHGDPVMIAAIGK